jgi:ribosomal protein S18 acetylase RimI-like enzyme
MAEVGGSLGHPPGRKGMGQGPAVIRRAEVTDLPAVEAIARTTWPVAYAGVIPDDIQRRLLDSWYSPSALARAFGAKESVFFVAEWDRALIGFAQYFRRSAEVVELTRIYVLPDRQRSGVGAQLLEAGLAAFGAQGARDLTVSVERDNAVGRRFYRRTGFTEVRELTQNVEGYLLRLVECRCSIRGHDE